MTCAQRDQHLLLLAHDALSFGDRLRTIWHVRRCARCQVRLNEFEMVSRVLSATINGRPAHGAFAQVPIVHGPRPSSPMALLLVVALTIVVLAGVSAAVVTRVSPHFIQATFHHGTQCRRVQTPPPGCAPNLPNDHCK